MISLRLGLDESLKNSIIDKYTSELARQQEAKKEKRQKDSQLLEVQNKPAFNSRCAREKQKC